jgi:hypothetical protein
MGSYIIDQRVNGERVGIKRGVDFENAGFMK